MGGDTSNNKANSPSNFGGWGQVDPFGAGDARKFEWAGGTEAQFKSMTPEQQHQFREISGKSAKEQGDWMKSQKFGSGADGGAAAQSDFMQSATPTTSTPWGSNQWTQDANGQWTNSTQLGGGLGSANESLQSMYAKLLGQGPMTGDAARQQAIDASYGQATSRLDPQWDKRQEALRTQLLNQGLDPTSEAGKNAMQDFGMQRNDAYTSAMNAAIQQGNSAGDSVFRNNQAAMNQPLQQMALIKALSQVNSNPGVLNALIAQKNYEVGQATNLQQQQADAINGVGAVLGGIGNMSF